MKAALSASRSSSQFDTTPSTTSPSSLRSAAGLPGLAAGPGYMTEPAREHHLQQGAGVEQHGRRCRFLCGALMTVAQTLVHALPRLPHLLDAMALEPAAAEAAQGGSPLPTRDTPPVALPHLDRSPWDLQLFYLPDADGELEQFVVTRVRVRSEGGREYEIPADHFYVDPGSVNVSRT